MANEKNTEQIVDETLNKTDFGQVINDNKKPILIIGAVIVVLIFAYSIFQNSKKSSMNLALSNAYDFKVQVIDAYTDKKIKSEEFINKMSQMPSSIKGEVSILPSVLVAVKALTQEGKLQESATILESWKSQFSESSFAYFFTSFNLSQVYDDLNKKDEALAILDTLKKSPIKILKSKILLDMARLQISTNQKEDAKSNLEIIVKDYKDSAESKEAQVLLTQL